MSPTAQRLPQRREERQSLRRRDHLRVVRPGEGRRFRPGVLGSLAVGMILVILFALASLQALLVQRQLEIDDVQRTVIELQAERNRLLTDVALLESPERIVSEAEQMGLVRPETVVYLTPPEDQPRRGAGGELVAQAP